MFAGMVGVFSQNHSKWVGGRQRCHFWTYLY